MLIETLEKHARLRRTPYGIDEEKGFWKETPLLKKVKGGYQPTRTRKHLKAGDKGYDETRRQVKRNVDSRNLLRKRLKGGENVIMGAGGASGGILGSLVKGGTKAKLLGAAVGGALGTGAGYVAGGRSRRLRKRVKGDQKKLYAIMRKHSPQKEKVAYSERLTPYGKSQDVAWVNKRRPHPVDKLNVTATSGRRHAVGKTGNISATTGMGKPTKGGFVPSGDVGKPKKAEITKVANKSKIIEALKDMLSGAKTGVKHPSVLKDIPMNVREAAKHKKHRAYVAGLYAPYAAGATAAGAGAHKALKKD